MCSLRPANNFLRKTVVTTHGELTGDRLGRRVQFGKGVPLRPSTETGKKPFILLPLDQETIFYDLIHFNSLTELSIL